MEIIEIDKNWLLDRANEENEKVQAAAERASVISDAPVKRRFFSSWLDSNRDLREKDKNMRDELKNCAESTAKLNFIKELFDKFGNS